jgi:hypothetical protein
MRRIVGSIIVTLLCLVPHTTAIAGFDGSDPLLCAVIEAFECTVEQDCMEGTLESMNIPQFVKVDFANNKISTIEETAEKRESPINNFDKADGMLILQGMQNGRGWSMVIAEETGKMTTTASGGGGGFVVFGACTLD